MDRKARDHIVVIAIIAVASVGYLGYSAMADKSAPGQQGRRPAPQQQPARDVTAFVENLPDDYTAVVNMANALMDRGDYQLAVATYRKAVELDASSPNVWADLGACLHAVGNNEEAVASFEKALELDPHHHIAKFNMGIVYYTLGDDARARQWWEQLLSENPPADMKARVLQLLENVK